MKEKNEECKNSIIKCKKCQRTILEGKYCENCRIEQVKKVKDVGKIALGTLGSVAVTVGGAAITILTKGKINPKK